MEAVLAVPTNKIDTLVESLKDKVANVTDRSSLEDPTRPTYRVTIEFKNGYELSIICGYGTYSTEGTYEVAVLEGDNGGFCGAKFDPDLFAYDDVAGHQTPEEVLTLARKVADVQG
jgi:hypothetical protein